MKRIMVSRLLGKSHGTTCDMSAPPGMVHVSHVMHGPHARIRILVVRGREYAKIPCRFELR